MTDREIRGLLRGATARKTIQGWKGPFADGTYLLNSVTNHCRQRPREYMIEYCTQLRRIGVEPVYTDLDSRLV